MQTVLFTDPVYGTEIRFNDAGILRITVHYGPFSKRTMALDLDDVDRLLALYEHAVNPVLDLIEFFKLVYHVPETAARRAAEAFIASAGSLAETIR